VRRDALELDRFYKTPQGRLTRRMVDRRLQAIWPELRGLDVLGLGFATPYLGRMRETARRSVAFMPSAQGAIAASGVSTVAMGDETHLPFPDALFDRVLLIHMLEEADSLPAILREAWRVLAPEGRIVIVTAARSGVWAWMDSTPFGHGRPFSRSQLDRLLADSMFEPTAWSRALYAPPWRWASHPRVAAAWERTGEHLWSGLGGLILVEAVKRTAALRPRAKTAPARVSVLEGQARPALSPPAVQSEPSDR